MGFERAGGGTAAEWTYVALCALTPVHSGTVSLHPIVDHLRQIGVKGPDDVYYYAGVEVGTEVANGRGSAIFTNFSVNVE